MIDEDNDFWKLLIEGVEMAAAENKMELTIVAPEREDDYEAQNELIEWAIGQKPDEIPPLPAFVFLPGNCRYPLPVFFCEGGFTYDKNRDMRG